VSATHTRVRLVVLTTRYLLFVRVLCVFCRGAEVELPPSRRKLTLIAAIDGSGRRYEPFVIKSTPARYRQVGRQRMLVAPAVNGVNEKLMLSFVRHLADHGVPRGCCVFLDNLRQHWSASVERAFARHGFNTRFFPLHLGRYLSPLDNSFFSYFKSQWACERDRVFDVRGDVALGEWTDAVRRAYNAVPADSVVAYFRACGLVRASTDESFARRVERVMASAIRRLTPLQAAALDAYREWAASRVEVLSSRSTSTAKRVQAGAAGSSNVHGVDSELDGRHWSSFGSWMRVGSLLHSRVLEPFRPIARRKRAYTPTDPKSHSHTEYVPGAKRKKWVPARLRDYDVKV
jgi:hypothetical protein